MFYKQSNLKHPQDRQDKQPKMSLAGLPIVKIEEGTIAKVNEPPSFGVTFG